MTKAKSKSNKRFHSMSEFLDEFFPTHREKEAIRQLTPEDLGELLAQNSLAKFKVTISDATKQAQH